MRKGLSLIELIFTIVIIAIVFMVIPKVVFALKKSDSFAIRQDAILNTVSLTQMLSKLPWDEENVNTKDILHVSADSFPCDPTSRLRIGGFVGSRNCEHDLNASALKADFNETNETNFDDIDDFNNYDFNTTALGNKIYEINIKVQYCQDFVVNSTNAPIDLQNCGAPVGTTNLKRVHLKTTYVGKGQNKPLLDFNYTSVNIGQLYLHKRVWQ